MTEKITLTDFSDIDWNVFLMRKRSQRAHDKQSRKEFWHKRAPSFADHAGRTRYPDEFIRIMNPDPSWTVLDIGCGAGTIALPLSPKVKEITAVDFAENMLSILSDEASRRTIDNIRTQCSGWDDDWESADIGIHDIAIASRSLAVNDLSGAITKLSSKARRRVMISTSVGDGPFDREMSEYIGRTSPKPQDYVCVYNLLYQMGIHANISFITEETDRTFAGIAEASEQMMWMFQEMTPFEESKLTGYLTDHLTKNADGTYTYHYPYKWAVFWWDK